MASGDSKVVDLADLNPEFRRRLGNFLTSAKAAGIPAHIIEAYRDRAVQAQYYAEKQKGLRPYPVAPPGTSFHEGGFASDILADAGNQQALIKYAYAHPEFGIAPLPGDAPHFQIAGYKHLADAIAHPPELQAGSEADLTPFIAANQGYSIAEGYKPGGGSTRVASTAPVAVPASSASAAPSGGSGPYLAHEQFIRDYANKIGVNPDLALGIARAEGMNAVGFRTPNQASTIDVSGGQPFSFGDFQLNVKGGLGANALAAGIDPRDPNQWQKADMFALDYMKKAGIAPWQGDPFAKSWMAAKKPVLGTSLASTPQQEGIVDPSIVARGGTSPAIPSTDTTPATSVAAAPAAAPSWGDKFFKRPTTTDDKGNVTEGKSPAEKLASSIGGMTPGANKEGAAEIPAMPTMAPVQDPMMQMYGPSQQLFQTISAQAAKPLSWSSRPYGYGAGQQMGTTLNATDYPYA